jgi:spore germination protein GerM
MNPSDSDLRGILDDAVSDVHPEGGTDQIRARAARPSATRWVPITLAAAAATAVVIGGGTWLAQQQSSSPPAAGPGSPQAPTSQAPTSEAPATRTVSVPVYYVGETANGPRLFPEQVRLTDVSGTSLQAAVDALVTHEPADPDYRGFPSDWGTVRATLADRVITIDLSDQHGISELTKEAQAAYVQAMVWTATDVAGHDLAVQFRVDGKPVADPFAGDAAGGPVQRASEDSVLSPVIVDSPAQGATVPTTFTVEGRAATFEANVVWELMRGDTTVRQGFTTAEECCTLAPYSFKVTAPPGDYTLVVHDTDESDGEGVGTSQDTKDITVE